MISNTWRLRWPPVREFLEGATMSTDAIAVWNGLFPETKTRTRTRKAAGERQRNPV